MTTPYEIPLVPSPQVLSIFLGGVQYQLRVSWNNFSNCWVVDLYDSTGVIPVVTGIPLVTGVDLFGQYSYLNLGGLLIAQTDGDLYTPPTFTNLGTTGHLYFVTQP